jgi:hypothetical protein
LFSLIGVPNRIRTGVAGVKGQCPWPLDDGDPSIYECGFQISELKNRVGLEKSER